MKLPLSNIIRVSILGAQRGLSSFNTSALAIITDEVPIPGDYGNSGVYLNPDGVAQDFGSNSETYRLAVAIFSQAPNILTGRGYLVVIPRDQSAAAAPATIVSSQTVDLTQLTAIDYNINVDIDGGGAADILIGSVDVTTLETAEADLNSTAITAAGLVFELSGEVTAASVVLKTSTGGAAKTLTLAASGTGTDVATILKLSGSATGADAGVERVKDAILRTNGAIEYFGIVLNEKQTDANLTELANYMQTLDKILFVGSNLSADITGVFKTIKDAGLTHTRCLYYSVVENDALDFAAGYASRGLCVNFSASNTVLTMHLKDITGLVADTGLTQTLLTSAGNNGVDVYADFGVPKVFTSGANAFFDYVYIQLAFKLDLIVAGFNTLGKSLTKIPQTETGMSALKKSYRDVCGRYVNAGAFGPGTWNDPTTFGNPEDHIRNIAESGFFVYSIPISQQSQIERSARIAPSVQIAAKSTGAIHSSDVIVFIEA